MLGVIAIAAFLIYFVTAIVTGGVGLAKDGEDRWERFHERITFNLWDLSRDPDPIYTTPDSSGDEAGTPTPTVQTGTTPTSGTQQNGTQSGGSGSIPVMDGTTLNQGDAAIVRVISGNTATVCYTESLAMDITVGNQPNGNVLAAWSTPSRSTWGWMVNDANREAEAIRNGSLSSMGVSNVNGPMLCR